MKYEIEPIGLFKSLSVYVIFSMALYFSAYGYLPYLINKLDVNPILSWHISGGVVFIMLFISAIAAYNGEVKSGLNQSILERLRLRKLTTTDLKWAGTGLIVLFITSGIVFYLEKKLFPGFSTNPAFMEMPAIKSSEWWLLISWAVMFFFNIAGEEIFWRGYLFPKQVKSFGKYAWILNSAGWLLFHIAFGWQMMLMLLPTVIIIPYIMQKRDNTTIGIVLHGTFNGLTYLAITLGGMING